MNSFRSNNLNLKYQTNTPSGCKDKETSKFKFEFLWKTKVLNCVLIDLLIEVSGVPQRESRKSFSFSPRRSGSPICSLDCALCKNQVTIKLKKEFNKINNFSLILNGIDIFKPYVILTWEQRNWVFVTNSDFIIPISLQSNFVDVRYFKLWILLDQITYVGYNNFSQSIKFANVESLYFSNFDFVILQYSQIKYT